MSATAIPQAPSPKAPLANPLTSGQLPRFAELYTVGGAAILSGVILGLTGWSTVGWLVLSAAVYLVAIALLSSFVENRRRAVDRVIRGAVTVAFLLALAPLISTLWEAISQGIGQLSWSFIFGTGGTHFDAKTLKVVSTQGAWQSVIGTFEMTGIAAVISIPIGLLTAIYLVEYARPTQWMARTVTFLVDVMTGIPSIVAGLFAFSLFTLLVGPKAFSGFSAAVALCVLMIPIVVRSSEEMLKLVSMELREASLALGVTKFTTIVRIVLPTAIAGLVTGVMLAIARVIGETAPIYIAASTTQNFNADPFNNPMSSLPVMAYTSYAYPGDDVAASVHAAWGAALLLIILVVILNLIARLVARVFAPKGLR